MIYAYEIKNDAAAVLRCYGYGTEVELPEEIAGFPVAELGAYAFSEHMDLSMLRDGLESGMLLLWDDVAGEIYPHTRLTAAGGCIEGAGLSSLKLPAALRKIGAYAFYNCSALKTISFHGGLCDLGAGLFTGCHCVRELHVTLGREETSCLREMLIELPEKLTVYMDGASEARLVFPEYFEESVENTPARILVTQMHGSGINYRNCFYARKIDFQAYDACFYAARAAEDFDTLLEMAVGRLMYPAGLSAQRRQDYGKWLGENIGTAYESVIKSRDMEALSFLADESPGDAARLRAAAFEAAAEGFAEGAAFLMDRLPRTKAAHRWEL